MEYSEEFEDELRDLESCALHLEICDERGQVDMAEERYFCACLDHIVNTYPVDCETLTDHTSEIRRTYRTRDNENTALKHIDTLHQAFMAGVCDDYDPQY